MKKISVVIAGRHQTSISLEAEFWLELQNIAKEKHQTINEIITEIDSLREHENLSSAIRVYILEYVKNKTNAA